MSIGWIKGLADAAKSCAKTGLIIVKAHTPELMIGSGVVGFGVTVYEACRATNKAHDILEEKEELILDRQRYCQSDSGKHYTEAMLNEDIDTINKRTRWKLIRAYTPMVTTGVASVILVLGGYRVLNGRYVGVAAAYKTLESGFSRYRVNVVNEYGEDVDYRMLHDIPKEDMEAALKERDRNEEIAEQNKGKIIKRKPEERYHEIYDTLFDPHSSRWRNYWNAVMMLEFLKGVQQAANDKLRINGHLFLNDVYDMLGKPHTPEGQVVGWLYNKGSFPYGYVDLGIDHMPEEELRRILSTTRNEDLRVWLRFNTLGVIYQQI